VHIFAIFLTLCTPAHVFSPVALHRLTIVVSHVNFSMQLVEEDLAASRRSLASREQLLRATLESTDEAIVVLAPDGTASLCNAQFRRLFGLEDPGTWEEAARNPSRLAAKISAHLTDPALGLRDLLQHQQGQAAKAPLRMRNGRIIEKHSAALPAPLEGTVIAFKVCMRSHTVRFHILVHTNLDSHHAKPSLAMPRTSRNASVPTNSLSCMRSCAPPCEQR